MVEGRFHEHILSPSTNVCSRKLAKAAERAETPISPDVFPPFANARGSTEREATRHATTRHEVLKFSVGRPDELFDSRRKSAVDGSRLRGR